MHSGEQTLLVTRPTRLISFRYYVLFVLFEVLAVVIFAHLIQGIPSRDVFGWSTNTIGAIALAFLGLISLAFAELKRASTRYMITDNKIIREDGILNKKTDMIPYTQLERVELDQSFLQRILRIGTLVVDTGDDMMKIEMVPKPAQVQELLSERMGRRAFIQQPQR